MPVGVSENFCDCDAVCDVPGDFKNWDIILYNYIIIAQIYGE